MPVYMEESRYRMRINYVFIDYENVQATSLRLLQPDHFKLRVFLGPSNTKLPTELVTAIHRLHDRADYVQLETAGTNALDFHIAYYLGVLSVEDPQAYFHIISRDKGFDPLIKHLRSKGIMVARSEGIEDMPCFNAPSVPLPQKNAAAKPSPGVSTKCSDQVINVVVADLVSRKSSKPRAVKTLKSTIHAKIGKEKPLSEVEEVYKVLRQRGYVKEAGTKVTYALPQLK